jgi:hypothetical protein
MARRPRIEGEARDSQSGQFQSIGSEHAERFGSALDSFKDAFPEDWEAIRLCPTQHGVEIIAEKLKG